MDVPVKRISSRQLLFSLQLPMVDESGKIINTKFLGAVS